jgi:signal transduction histidine kinase
MALSEDTGCPAYRGLRPRPAWSTTIIDRVEPTLTILRPLFTSDTYKSLLFVLAAPPIAGAALGVLIAGWAASSALIVTPLVVAALVGFRGAVGLLACGDAGLGRALLGVDVQPRIGSGGNGYWGRAKAVVADRSFWKQQAYLALRATLGFQMAIVELALVAGSLGSITYPIWYRWGKGNKIRFGSWHVDHFPRSLVLVPAGVVGLVVAAWLARLLGRAWAGIIRGLLADGTTERIGVSRHARRLALDIHAGVAAGIGALLLVIWALTGRGYVWPEWALLPLALQLASHAWIELVEDRPRLRVGRSRAMSVHLGLSVALFAFLALVWALTTRGYFWPVWPALGLAIALAVHAAIAWVSRGNRLAHRVDVLEATRAGAVDVQDAELRRIERDLHDGAQARLVALGMSLGLAEQKFAADPEGARELVAEARHGVGEALRELRDLARGIHPPVLSDRGLGAALATLADQSGLPVTVAVDLDGRLAPPVETAAYFVAAEALANAAKHSGASRVAVRARRNAGVLELEVEDDGRGGADPSGSGLTGLRRRVEALDGTLDVASPAGGPTTVRAELPCAS